MVECGWWIVCLTARVAWQGGKKYKWPLIPQWRCIQGATTWAWVARVVKPLSMASASSQLPLSLENANHICEGMVWMSVSLFCLVDTETPIRASPCMVYFRA